MNILDLNYDVLLHIVEYLTLDEQLVLWQASQPTSTLNVALYRTWQLPKKRELCGPCFEGKQNAVLDAFLGAVSGTLRQLTLRCVPKDQLAIWQKHRFPKMRILIYDEDDSGPVDESQIKLLTEFFPLLEAVTVNCRRMSRHLSNWKNLSYLDLRQCWNISPEAMEHVLGNLRLRVLKIAVYQLPFPSIENSLQELEELEFGIVSEIIPGLSSLPKLRKFTYNAFFTDPWIIIDNIGDRRILSETTNVLTFYFMSQRAWVYFQKVLNLTIVGVGHKEHASLHIYRNFKRFRCLQQLHLHSLNLWTNADQLWEMVDDCPKLKTLIVTKPMLSFTFFNLNQTKMRQVLRRRADPLLLVFDQVSCKQLIKQFFRHPNLSVIFQAVDCTHLRDHMFVMELLPLNTTTK
ncbi:uncharacterized protein LOC111079291 [Drosophila obscura]|uniref:uncharacterized protein LOC111079291 n=1 Tax=Drosophila obscura TaxID=7282 RepID=UPI001BB0E1B9|nr:uncharacterized protein LOC111079291 [Drosophila obscura]